MLVLLLRLLLPVPGIMTGANGISAAAAASIAADPPPMSALGLPPWPPLLLLLMLPLVALLPLANTKAVEAEVDDVATGNGGTWSDIISGDLV